VQPEHVFQAELDVALGELTFLADAGVPIDVIRELAGHADIRTTTIYTAVNDDRLEAAIDDAARRRRGLGKLAA